MLRKIIWKFWETCGTVLHHICNNYDYISLHVQKKTWSLVILCFTWPSQSMVFEHLGICVHFHQSYHTWQAYDQVAMALAFNNNHIIYYHMDA